MAAIAPARPAPTPATPASASRRAGLRLALVAALSLVIAVVALVLPEWPAGEDMGSTHYMGLLAANQPWNLLLFMAVPVIAAETIAITELAILFGRRVSGVVRALNRWAGLIGGFYFLGVFVYLMKHAVVPLTTSGGWRGGADLAAVGFYLLGVVPLFGMALLETGVVGAGWDEQRRLKMHATFVGIFLVVAHVAMIAGMLDPTVVGWDPSHQMTDGSTMPGSSMDM